MGVIRCLPDGPNWKTVLLEDEGTSGVMTTIGVHSDQGFTNAPDVEGKALAVLCATAFAAHYGHTFEPSNDPFE